MANQPLTPHNNKEGNSHARLDFWQAINSAAAAVQRAARSETAVYDAFGEQLVKLGMYAAISMVEDTKETLTLTAAVLSDDQQQKLMRLAERVGFTPIGYQYAVHRIPAIQEVIENAQSYFVEDNTRIIIDGLPPLTKPILKRLVSLFGAKPAILTPMLQDGQVVSVMYISGDRLTPEDLPALSAFSNHLAIALENARLFQSMQAESEQLRRNEEQLRILAENVPGVVYQCKNNYTFDMLYLNDAVETLTGYPKAWFLSGRLSFRDLYHPEDSPLIHPEAIQVFRDIDIFHHIYRIRHRSGEWRWVEEFGSGVFDEQGDLLFLEGSITDITERHQAELLQSTLYRIATVAHEDLTLAKLYEAIHTILGDLMEVRNFYIALYDEDTGLMEFPYFVDEMDSFDPQPFNASGGLTDFVIKTGQPQLLSRLELKRLMRQGRLQPLGTFPEIWLGAPLRTQTHVFGAIVVQHYRDASVYTEREKHLLFFVSGQVAAAIDRKRSEEKLKALAEEMRHQKNMFEAILSTTPDQFAVFDPDGRFIFVSQKILDLLDKSLEEIVGKTWDDLSYLPAELWCQSEEERQKVCQTGEIIQGEVQISIPVGVREVEYILSPIKDEAGHVIAVVSTVRDITERNKTKAALHQARRMESLGMLAGGVAHDFNNLLVGMMAQTSLALAKLPEDNPAVKNIQKAIKSAERAAVLTNQLLAYSGQGQFTIRQVMLNELIRDNQQLFQVTAAAHITIAYQLIDHPLPLDGDPGQIQQVLVNLILNSSEAISHAKGTIMITTRIVEITGSEEQYWEDTNQPLAAGHYISLQLQDDGEGIEAANRAQIFEPFFTTKFTGRGLGLSAVLGIVRGHQGGIAVHSVPAEGTTIDILFPLSDAFAQMPLPAREPGLTARRVLVIDDEEPVREAVSDILELEGIEVLTAVDGSSGVAVYQENQAQIGLVLLDLSLPDIRGLQVFSHLKEIDPEVRVILSSGYSEHEAVQGFEPGLVDFLQKPYQLDTLVQVVNRYLAISEV